MPGRIAAVLALGAVLASPAAAQYFPALAFSDRPELHEFTAGWYERHLSAMEEPPLLKSAGRKNVEVYRFLWLRTFHPPLAFRLEVRGDGTGSLTAKSASGAGGYDPGRLDSNRTLALDAKRVRQFTAALGRLDFWKLATRDPGPPGFDGARWVLEGAKGGRYHVVDRWSPTGGAFRQAMLDLVALAGMKVNPIY